MNILKTYETTVVDIYETKQHLTTLLTESDGIYGFACHLQPADQHAHDTGFTQSLHEAEKVYAVLCSEKVLPLELDGVLDDMYVYN